MLKFTGIIGSVLASLVVVPAATLGNDRGDSPVESLETALSQTVEALDLLTGMKAKAKEGVEISAMAARELSEDPLPGDEERDQRLQILRTQVSLLQQELDILEFRMKELRTGTSFRSEGDRPGEGLTITKGLGTDVLTDIRELERPVVQSKELAPPVEHFGYSADPLLEGQACYRAGQYERGIDLLENLESIAGQYWLGRCLERAGYLERAATVYRAVIAAEDGGSFGERAKTNLDFVEWKIRFSSTLGESPKK